ncbi:alpha/beta fold hydrolase [Breznakiellaceae bacterium SP9]
MDDGARLFTRQWKPPAGAPWAALQIIHGMEEHSRRYNALGAFLSQSGVEVWAADLRGHGKTADPALNPPELGGLAGHCADFDGCTRVTKDIARINRLIADALPDVPRFILGHSWGSFIAQNFMEHYIEYIENEYIGNFSARVSGFILSGTRGPAGIGLLAGKYLTHVIAGIKGPRARVPLLKSLSNGAYNKAFRPARTPADWLSRDEAAVAAFIKDPLCGILSSVGFYRDMTALLCSIHKKEALARIPKSLPVYVFSGSADSAGRRGRSPTALVSAYRALNLTDLEFVLYPNARHETLNETNRREVQEELLSWLQRHGGSNG